MWEEWRFKEIERREVLEALNTTWLLGPQEMCSRSELRYISNTTVMIDVGAYIARIVVGKRTMKSGANGKTMN